MRTKFLKGKKPAICLHGTRGSVKVFERQTVQQSVTEFARFRVNVLYGGKLRPSKICRINLGIWETAHLPLP